MLTGVINILWLTVRSLLIYMCKYVDETVLSFLTCKIESVSTIPDECMEVETEISTVDILGNEVSENRSERLSVIDRRYSQC